jgi:hypothetical protein
MLHCSTLTSPPRKATLLPYWLVSISALFFISVLEALMPDPLAPIALFLAMALVLCGPPLALMKMLLRRQALVKARQRPMVQATILTVGGALVFNVVVTLFARPATQDSEALWGSITAVHVAALLLSWLAFWGCVALAVLHRHRRSAKRPGPSESGGGEMA